MRECIVGRRYVVCVCVNVRRCGNKLRIILISHLRAKDAHIKAQIALPSGWSCEQDPFSND